MMKRIFGFCAGCAVAGVLAGPDSDINIVAPSSEAQDRKPGVLRGGVAIKGGLVANTVLNMASLSLFMMRQKLLA
jgi:hypothetical protein